MTGHITKPGVDWSAIEVGYREGKSCRQLARDHLGISHVAIAKRAKKHGWKAGQSVETARALTALVAETSGSIPGAHKASDTKRATILTKLSEGSTLTLAAKSAGIDRNTLTDWRKDAKFLLACDAAEATFAEKQLGHIEKAADRGDWRAASWRLERAPATRDEFGQQVRPAVPTLQVILKMPYPKAIEGEIIDVETPE